MASVIEVSLIAGETERAGAVSPRHEEAQENLIHVHKCLMGGGGGVKKREGDSSQSCPLTGEEAMGKT